MDTIVTLLSDFGLNDATVAISKGILLQHVRTIRMVDLSHEIKPYNYRDASYILVSACKNFPPETIHVVLFDIFYDKNPRLILSEIDNQYFVTPDNGVLPFTFGSYSIESWHVMSLKNEEGFIEWMNEIGLLISKMDGKSASDLNLVSCELKLNKNIQSGSIENSAVNSVTCAIKYIDNFENVVLDITKSQFEAMKKGNNFTLRFKKTEELGEINTQYSDVKEGNKLCRFNTSGYLEICINKGKAASLFGLNTGGKNNKIEIIFK